MSVFSHKVWHNSKATKQHLLLPRKCTYECPSGLWSPGWEELCYRTWNLSWLYIFQQNQSSYELFHWWMWLGVHHGFNYFLDRRFWLNMLTKLLGVWCLLIPPKPSGQHSHSYSFDVMGSHFSSTNFCGWDELSMTGFRKREAGLCWSPSHQPCSLILPMTGLTWAAVTVFPSLGMHAWYKSQLLLWA